MTALVDRSWQDTYTFHFLVGEDTITLQDVVVLLRLQIDGRPVISAVLQDVWATCHGLLGLTSDDYALEITKLWLQWLHENLDADF